MVKRIKMIALRALSVILFGSAALMPLSSMAWPGCQCKLAQGGTKCLPHLPQFDCDATCSSDGGSSTHGTPVAMCPAESQQCSGYDLSDISWTMWHQGAAVYQAPDETDVIADPNTLKYNVASKQNGAKQQCIKDIPESQIVRIVRLGIQECKAKKLSDITGDFNYVAIHEGKLAQMKADAQKHYYQGVRDVFAYVQGNGSDKDNKQHELYCMSGPDIDGLIANAH